jgi:hypothetical protein
MTVNAFLRWCALVPLLVSTQSIAQSAIAQGSTVVIPLVSQTGTFSSEIWIGGAFVQGAVTVNVRFYDAVGAATPGLRTCTPVVVGANQVVSFSLATQCTLTPPPASHYGLLVLEDAAAEKLNLFYAYARTENFKAIGLSVEGFPIGQLSAQTQQVAGLKRVAAPVPFDTNCFVAALAEAVDYRIRLRNGTTNAKIGADIMGSLMPYEIVRYLDVFKAAGLTTGDFTNVAAVIQRTNAQSPTDAQFPMFIGFCTVQDDVNFGADFRIGKSFDGFDYSFAHDFENCLPADGCPYDYAIDDVTRKKLHAVFLRPPDAVRCDLRTDQPGALEMRLREPGATPGPVVAGGNDQTGFYYETGPSLIRHSDGFQLRYFWLVEVSAREGTTPVLPIGYSIECKSGNGALQSPITTTASDDF